MYKKGDYVRCYRESDPDTLLTNQKYDVYFSRVNNNSDVPNSETTDKWVKKNGNFTYNSSG